MKKDYFTNLSDADNWRQKSENNESATDKLDFLKYRLHQIGDTSTFNDKRLQQPSYPKINRVAIQPQIWNQRFKAKIKASINFIAIIRRLIMLTFIVIQTYFATFYLSSLLPYQSWQRINFWNNWGINPELAIYSIIPYIIQWFIVALFAILFFWI